RRVVGPVVLQQPDLHRGDRLQRGRRREVANRPLQSIDAPRGFARRVAVPSPHAMTSTPTSDPTAPRVRWWREPLLHFTVLGALLFAIDHHLASRADDPHVIVIDAAVDAQARQVFKAARGREPNDEELYALRRVWLDNEVLYREGLALQVDKGDSAIR